jgi:hypothetical protein
VIVIVIDYLFFKQTPDLLRPSENYYQCISQDGGGALIGIIVGFSALILFVGSVLAYRVRSVPMKVVNESKVIAISVCLSSNN